MIFWALHCRVSVDLYSLPVKFSQPAKCQGVWCWEHYIWIFSRDLQDSHHVLSDIVPKTLNNCAYTVFLEWIFSLLSRQSPLESQRPSVKEMPLRFCSWAASEEGFWSYCVSVWHSEEQGLWASMCWVDLNPTSCRSDTSSMYCVARGRTSIPDS